MRLFRVFLKEEIVEDTQEDEPWLVITINSIVPVIISAALIAILVVGVFLGIKDIKNNISEFVLATRKEIIEVNKDIAELSESVLMLVEFLKENEC